MVEIPFSFSFTDFPTSFYSESSRPPPLNLLDAPPPLCSKNLGLDTEPIPAWMSSPVWFSMALECPTALAREREVDK